MKAVLVFCEGNHDIVFVTRSLGELAGAKWLGGPISDLPSPFGPRHDPSRSNTPIVKSFIAERIRGRQLDGLHLMDAAHPPPPSFQTLLRLPHDDVVYALLKSGGDNGALAAIDLIKDLVTQLQFGVDVTEIAAAFLFDADTAGVEARENSFAADHTALLAGVTGPTHNTWVKGNLNGSPVPIGLFVFHDPNSRTGTLEEVFAPMVSSEWPDRWLAAGEYLVHHQTPTDPVTQKRADSLKAQMCITGQFRCPGDPLSQVLGRNGLSKYHFTGGNSRSLVGFLRAVPW